jgi:hypothetical protein
MKLSRKELKEIIREHLKEGVFDFVPPEEYVPESEWSSEEEEETLPPEHT